MKSFSLQAASAFLPLLFLLPSSSADFYSGAVTITDFFLGNDNTGYGHGYTSFGASSCENIIHRPDMTPDYYWEWVGITNTGCINLYFRTDCEGAGKKMDGGYLTFKFNDAPKSFRACDSNASQAFPFVDRRVKLYRDYDYGVQFEDKILYDSDCITLPGFFKKEVSSAKLPFCVNFYDEENCSGSRLKLEKGDYRSLGDTPHFFNDKLVSYKPCNANDLLKRPQINAKVVKFEVFQDEDEVRQRAMNVNVEMASNLTFHNTSPSTLTKKYDVSKTVKETSTVKRSTTASNMHKVSVGAEIKTEFKAGFKFLFEEKVSVTLKAAYEYTKTDSSTDEKTFTHEVSKTFTISDTIPVPPCTELNLYSYIDTTQNYPLHYITTFEVRGQFEDGAPFRAEEVRKNLGSDMKYVRTIDDYTILATSESTMVVDVAFISHTVMSGDRIPDCKFPTPYSLIPNWRKTDHKNAKNVALFKHTNLNYNFLSINQAGHNTCHVIPREKVGQMKSIKSEACIALYSSDSCSEGSGNKDSFKHKLTSREASDLPQRYRMARSIRLCEDEQSGDSDSAVMDSSEINYGLHHNKIRY